MRFAIAFLLFTIAAPSAQAAWDVCAGMTEATIGSVLAARKWAEAGCNLPEHWKKAVAADDEAKAAAAKVRKELEAKEQAERLIASGRFGEPRDDPRRSDDGAPHPLFPKRKGQCITSRLSFVGGTDEAASGAQLETGPWFSFYGNDDFVPALQAAARGGHVLRICYGAPPPRQHSDGTPCPKWDKRGTSYIVTDTVTKQTFNLSEDLHVCGGA